MKKHLKISFDFDGTLVDEFGGLPKNEQKEFIQSLVKKYKNLGHDVMILTKRYGPEFKNKGLRNEYEPVYYLAKELGIKKVQFTNREMKFSYIINMNIDVHFDDDKYESQLIKQVCNEKNHKCLVINIKEKNWQDILNEIK